MSEHRRSGAPTLLPNTDDGRRRSAAYTTRKNARKSRLILMTRAFEGVAFMIF